MQLEDGKQMNLDSLRDAADDAADLLSILANANRLVVLCHLLDGEKAVGQLAGAVGMNQPALSQQLARLRAMKLVSTRRDGRTIYYSLASDEVARILLTLYGIYCTEDIPAPERGQEQPASSALAE